LTPLRIIYNVSITGSLVQQTANFPAVVWWLECRDWHARLRLLRLQASAT